MEQRVRCIDDNEEALAWRLSLIENAGKSLILSTFEWREDLSGLAVMSAIWAAAERGVKVCLFLDGIYGLLDLRKSDPFYALVSHPNIRVKFYNPVNLPDLPKFNYRMHDKYLIVDDCVYLLGGRNTYDYFLGNAPGRKNFDRELLVWESDPSDPDSSIAQLKAYFTSIWSLPCSREVTRTITGNALLSGRETLKQTLASLKEQDPAAFIQKDLLRETIPVSGIRLLANPQRAAHREPTLWHLLCSEMTGKKDVLVQTPYIICGKEMYADLAAVCQKTDSVRILINAVENGANPCGCTDYLNQKQAILKTGATVCEFIGDRSVHTKTILIDDDTSIVGSYNLDMRSTYLDTELMLLVKSRELNEQLRAIADEELRKSRRVSPDGTVQDGEEYVSRELPHEMKYFYSILKQILKFDPIRSLL